MGIESLFNSVGMETNAKKLDGHIAKLDTKITELSLAVNKCSKLLQDNVMNEAKKLIEDFKKIVVSMNEAAKPITEKLHKASKMGANLERGL